MTSHLYSEGAPNGCLAHSAKYKFVRQHGNPSRATVRVLQYVRTACLERLAPPAGSALLYLRARGFDISLLYPRPTLRGTLQGLGLFMAAWFVGALVTTLFYTPGQSRTAEFSFSGVTLLSIVLFAMVNGAFEEVFLLGALVNGLRGLGLSLAIGLPLLVRVAYHLYQGPLGAVWVLAFGITFTVGYIVTRDLWPPVLAHILWDIVPLL